jgi:hypothetical protein
MHFRFLLCLLTTLSCPLLADQAFFSADGKSVTFVPRAAEGHLLRLDLSTAEVAKIPLLGEPAKESVTSLCRGGDGEALFTTESGVYVHDAKGTRKLAPTPAKGDWGIENLTAAPADLPSIGDWLLLSGPDESPGRRTFFARKPGTKAFSPVFCRRVESVGALAFAPGDRMFFEGDGDLWEGAFESMDGEPGQTPTLVLNGARIAPLGLFNTDMANSGNMWVHEVMVAGDALYVRLRGRHMSQIIRLPIHPTSALKGESGPSHDPAKAYKYMAEMLALAEVVTPPVIEVTLSAATAAEGDEKVFYRSSDGEGKLGLYLWERNTSKAQRIATEPEQP